MQNALQEFPMQDRKIWEQGMNFTEMIAKFIITDYKICSEVTSEGGRERDWEKKNEKEITTLALLIINTSVIAILRRVHRQVAENR